MAEKVHKIKDPAKNTEKTFSAAQSEVEIFSTTYFDSFPLSILVTLDFFTRRNETKQGRWN